MEHLPRSQLVMYFRRRETRLPTPRLVQGQTGLKIPETNLGATRFFFLYHVLRHRTRRRCENNFSAFFKLNFPNRDSSHFQSRLRGSSPFTTTQERESNPEITKHVTHRKRPHTRAVAAGTESVVSMIP